MALVDTQGFATAVDRSLFGPQGRRWVERKLPEVVANVAFIAVSTFGACVLMLHVSAEYHALGYWAILHTPKHVINGVVVHLIARALRWHVDRMLGHSFQVEDEGPGFFEASNEGGDDDVDRDRAAPVLWPWQSGGNASARKARPDVPETPSEDSHNVWRDPGGDAADDSGRASGHHRRSRSAGGVEGVAKGVASAAAVAAAAASQHGSVLGGGGGGGGGGGSGGGSIAVPSSPGSRAAGRSGNDEPRGGDEASGGLINDSHHGSHKNQQQQQQQQQQHHNHKNNIHFPNLFAACQPGGQQQPQESPSPSPLPSPLSRRNPPMSADRPRRRASLDNRGSPYNRDSPPTSPRRECEAFDCDDGPDADRFSGSHTGNSGGGGSSSSGRGSGESRRSEAGGAARGSRSGWTSDDGGAGGHGTGSRGSRRRLRALTASSPDSPVASSSAAVGAGGTAEGEGDDGGPQQVAAKVAAAAAATVAAVTAAAADSIASGDGGGGGGDRGGGGGRSVSRWTSIDKWSRALGTSRRRGSRQQPKMKFFTEDDFDELLHSTFFIKMCDDASWLYVEEQPHHPQLNWLLSFWGGFKIAPRFPGEVTQHEAHRMLFQCENGRHKGHVRIRSRATNTFLFFLGIKHPLTWVAWDRDVVGGDWEDLRLEWVGTPAGPDGVLVGDERGRVIAHCRSLNAYVSWNGTGFTHVQAKEGATVFMLQRMSHSSSSTTASPARPGVSGRLSGLSLSRRHSVSGGDGGGGGGGGGGSRAGSGAREKDAR